MRYWQPLGAKITATCTLPHPENERQRSVNGFLSCIFGNQSIAQLFEHITELLNASIGKNTIYHRKNTDSKAIDIANCKSCKHVSLVVEYAILIRYYYQTPTTRALYEAIDGPAGGPANNPPDSVWLGDFHRHVPKLMVRDCRQPGPPIWQWFGLDPDPDPKWLSSTVAITIPG